MRVYLYGKDAEGFPCVELDDRIVISEPELLMGLVKLLQDKGIIVQEELKNVLKVHA